jgi:DNA polymerase bacteriophage-type
MIWLDFETRSRCDLRASGVYNYAQDASTQVLCMSYAVDDGDVQTWTRGPLPDLTGHIIYAHNAAFERLIFQYVLDMPMPPERFVCTAAQARSNCLPGSLEDIGRAMSSRMRKDFRGSQLIRRMCVPPFEYTPALMAEMIQYCEQDVRAMRAISKALRPLSAEELADYHVNERINDRGVMLDLPLAEAAVRYAAAEMTEIQDIVCEVTQREIVSVRSTRMKDWVWDRVGPQSQKLMTLMKKKRAHRCLDKTVRASLLVLAEEDPTEVPPDVADVIQCADDLMGQQRRQVQPPCGVSRRG